MAALPVGTTVRLDDGALGVIVEVPGPLIQRDLIVAPWRWGAPASHIYKVQRLDDPPQCRHWITDAHIQGVMDVPEGAGQEHTVPTQAHP